jgi:hypothetical protein
VSFSEHPPSQQWAALKYLGEKLAEVWFKPEGEPLALTFRIPQESFQVPGMDQGLTTENLLRAVGIAPEEVDSWRHADVSHAGLNGSNPEFQQPLPPPPEDATHLSIHVTLKPPGQAVTPQESGEPEPPARQKLEARWKLIMGLEATIDHLRLRVEALLAEIEAACKRTLTPEEKMHALSADVAQWNKAKSRAHYAMPKAREFIHRATWTMGTPERKKLGEVFKIDRDPDAPFPPMDKLPAQLESLLKERQVVSAQGAAAQQKCRSLLASIQGALQTLQSKADARAKEERAALRRKGKFFKDVRRWSGAE